MFLVLPCLSLLVLQAKATGVAVLLIRHAFHFAAREPKAHRVWAVKAFLVVPVLIAFRTLTDSETTLASETPLQKLWPPLQKLRFRNQKLFDSETTPARFSNQHLPIQKLAQPIQKPCFRNHE